MAKISYPRGGAAVWLDKSPASVLLDNEFFGETPARATYVWTGTAFIPGVAKVWTGVVWLAGNIRRWSGSAWE